MKRSILSQSKIIHYELLIIHYICTPKKIITTIIIVQPIRKKLTMFGADWMICLVPLCTAHQYKDGER